MRELLPILIEAFKDRRPLAYCRLVATRGSTPQKAGAVMLVATDGTQYGTLGGGCVEAEVKRQAISILGGRTSKVMQFQLDNDYGWDDGLICGGRMDVMIQPFGRIHAEDEQAQEYFQAALALHQVAGGGLEAIAFDTDLKEGPVPCCLLFNLAGELQKQFPTDTDQAKLLASVSAELSDRRKMGRPTVLQGVAYLPIPRRSRLVIIGGGHVGLAVAELAGNLDFEVTIVDDREEFITEDRFPMAHARLCGPFADVLPALTMDQETYCLIVTRGHNHDQDALFHLVSRNARYIGMIGSRRKVRLIYDNLMAEGVAQEELARVHAPVGIDIGSQTVAEIAVSIAAELVAFRNCQGQVPGRMSRD